jgi:hypothetical protein
MREVIKRHGETDHGDEDRGKGLRSAGLPSEPDAHQRENGNGDGREQADHGYGKQVHSRRRAQRGEAVQEHGQDHELHEEQRKAASPGRLMGFFHGEARRRIACGRKAHVSAFSVMT